MFFKVTLIIFVFSYKIQSLIIMIPILIVIAKHEDMEEKHFLESFT